MTAHRRLFLIGLSWLAVAAAQRGSSPPAAPGQFPANKATGVNPDTHLVLRFSTPPSLGSAGLIRIHDALTHTLVDTLDLAVAPGPRAGAAGRGAPDRPQPTYQRTVIGGFTEGFHFYPVIVHDNVATIYPHNNVLTYDKTYTVQIDAGVLVAEGFSGIADAGWTFSTKPKPPDPLADRLVVAADGTGDFNTVQGAVDFIPDRSPRRVTVFIRAGTYEEIVYFRNKANITFLGEDRERVTVGYANNETFNGPPPGVPTNEKPATFPYRRASFMADHSSGIHIVNLSLRNFTPEGGGQAEALLLMGGENIVSHANLYSHQDTVQFNDSVYVEHTYIEGDTDFMWGRGPAFFRDSEIRELSSSPFMWVRSTSASHGFVFVNCTLDARERGDPGPLLGRNTAAYPNSEVVLINCALGNVNPAAWSLPGDPANLHYWEYNSIRLSDGKPAEVSLRHPASKQLTKDKDAETIANYSNPAYVLGGWSPSMAPIVLTQPASATVTAGQAATFGITAAAVPAATYQWRRNGVALADGNGLSGTTTVTLTLSRVRTADRGAYTVTVRNAGGSAVSSAAALSVR